MFDPAPDALIDANGRPRLGIYGEPLRRLNLHDFDYRAVAPWPFRWSRRLSRLAIKRWQYIGLVSDSLVVGAAVVDIGYVAKAFAYCYLREEGRVRDFSFDDFTHGATQYSATSVEGVSEYKSGGKLIRFENTLVDGKRRITIDIPGGFSGEYSLDENDFTPLCAVTRNGLRGFNYCHKAMGLPVEGMVRVGDRQIDLAADNALGGLDWTAGCAAHETYWNWASAAGRLDDGRTVGLNLVSGINDRGFTENGYWIDGRPVKVDVVHFEYDEKAILQPWTIRSNDGRVDLRFEPEGERSENLNFGVLASRFHQPFGVYTGTLTVDDAPRPVRLYGFAEEHEARW
ncbi:MAG: DUF2804 domain-containing protein [Deltaproteobacteria bacterium]|nr:DUF2804 domain-containing protein [Deltaproteobacteria bacterium]